MSSFRGWIAGPQTFDPTLAQAMIALCANINGVDASDTGPLTPAIPGQWERFEPELRAAIAEHARQHNAGGESQASVPEDPRPSGSSRNSQTAPVAPLR